MLAAYKYLDLQFSTINVASFILSVLLKEKNVMFDELMQRVVKTNGADSKYNFMNACSFLFLLGKIEYNKHLRTVTLL